ncbi:MAG: SecDF P1 head subdomain-containing protein [Thiohalospira sp.]
MTRFSILIFLITSSLLTSCGQTKKKSTIDKVTIDIQRVDKIEISKGVLTADSSDSSLKILTKEQIDLFATNWNKTDNPTLRKYLPSYNLTLYLKHGAIRKFRTGGRYIKENNDYCYDFIDSNFFATIYENAIIKEDSSDFKLHTGWYYISDTVTDYKRQLDKTLEFYYINPEIIVSDENFIKMEVTENKYQNEKYAMLKIRFDKFGTERWSIATEKSIGGQLAMIVNDKLVIAPHVNNQITSGISAINRTDYSIKELNEIMTTIEKYK